MKCSSSSLFCSRPRERNVGVLPLPADVKYDVLCYVLFFPCCMTSVVSVDTCPLFFRSYLHGIFSPTSRSCLYSISNWKTLQENDISSRRAMANCVINFQELKNDNNLRWPSTRQSTALVVPERPGQGHIGVFGIFAEDIALGAYTNRSHSCGSGNSGV